MSNWENLDPLGDVSAFSPSGDGTFRSSGRLQNGTAFGFRAWRVYVNTKRLRIPRAKGKGLDSPIRWVNDPMNGTLTGCFRTDYYYAPGWNTALCARFKVTGHTRSPHFETVMEKYKLTYNKVCGCGFYQYSATDHPDVVPVNAYATGQTMYAQGVVQTAGRHLFGTKGYQAEKARIVALKLPLDGGTYDRGTATTVREMFAPRLERLIRQKYPDVAIFDSVQHMVREFPLTAMPTAEAAQ